MVSFVINFAALLLYLAASFYQLMLIKRQQQAQAYFLMVTAAAIALHAIGIYRLMVLPEGLDLGINKMGSLVMVTVNLLVMLSSMRKPLHNLFIFLFPLSIIAIILALLQQQHHFIISYNILYDFEKYGIFCLRH